MPHGLLAYNPGSGRYPSELLAERAARVLQTRGWQIDFKQTQDAQDITRLARQAAEEGLEAFFIAGGDGSINLAIDGLAGSDTALGVLPAGTANVWAQELGLPGLTWTRYSALEESALRLAEGEVRTIDIGRCNGKPFLLWAGIGLDAFVVHRLEPRNRWEKHFAVVHYVASAVWNASFWTGMYIHIKVDDQEIMGHYLLALVSNVHLYAGGIVQLSPDARLNDGWMDLWLFKGETLGDTVQRFWDLFSGRHLQSEQVLRYPFQSLTIDSDSKIYVQVDGEPLEGSEPISIWVQPMALRVLVPVNTPHLLFQPTG